MNLMRPEFWHDRWQQGRIGFHRSSVHPELIAHAERFLGAEPCRVLVPLCGKSLDLGWLVARGHAVVGVELSERAARQYHEAAGIQPSVTAGEGYALWRSPGLSYHIGNVFSVPLEPVDAIWDRAALVALSPEQRPRYAARLLRTLAPGGRMLLSSLTYDGDHDGPPHSISDDEVREYYAAAGRLTLMSDTELIDEEPRWREEGATTLRSKMWLLETDAA